MAVSNQFLTVTQTAKRYPAFTVASLRWLMFNRANNGFDRCTVKLGRRVLIDEAEFIAFMREHREAKVAA